MTPRSAQPGNGEETDLQMEYIFEEWVSLCNNYNASSRLTELFVKQLMTRNVIRDRDDYFVFVRTALDMSVVHFERSMHAATVGDSYIYVDALATLISMFVSIQPESSSARPATLDATLSLISLIAYNHQAKQGEHMCQRVFFRLLSMLLHQFLTISDEFGDEERRELLLRFGARFAGFGPVRLPIFTYGWLALLQHRIFLPQILSQPNREGWPLYAKLLSQLLDCVGEQLKAVNVSPIGKDLYRATWKLLVVIQHDFPQFMSAYSMQFCASIPAHCTQLINTITAASAPSTEEESASTVSIEQATETLRDSGLLEVLDRAVQNGSSEEVVAQIAHAISQGTTRDTGFGYAPLTVNVRLIAAVTVYLGHELDARSPRYDGFLSLNGNEPEIATLSLLIHEVSPAARYHLLTSLVNQLQAPNQRTDCFSQILLSIFGKDMDDPEEMELRADITRVLLERLGGYWPHPWGLIQTVLELLKNEKYTFFELPFIKSDPDVSIADPLRFNTS
jgi:CCR4-NOT transcription complex subunit 1